MRPLRHADAHRNIRRFRKAEVVDADAAQILVFNIAAFPGYAPHLQKAILRAQFRPPLGRKPAPAASAVARRRPYSQLSAVDADGDIALPRIAVHGRLRTGLEGKLQPVDFHLFLLLIGKAVFKHTLLKPDELRAKAFRDVKPHRIIHIADIGLIPHDAAGRFYAVSAGVAADRHLQRKNTAFMHFFRHQRDSHGIRLSAADFHRAARAGLYFGHDQPRLLQRLDRQRRRGHGDVQPLRQLAHIHTALAQRPHNPDAHRRGERMCEPVQFVLFFDFQFHMLTANTLHAPCPLSAICFMPL